MNGVSYVYGLKRENLRTYNGQVTLTEGSNCGFFNLLNSHAISHMGLSTYYCFFDNVIKYSNLNV